MGIGLLGVFIVVSGVIGYLVGQYRISQQDSPTINHQVPTLKRKER